MTEVFIITTSGLGSNFCEVDLSFQIAKTSIGLPKTLSVNKLYISFAMLFFLFCEHTDDRECTRINENLTSLSFHTPYLGHSNDFDYIYGEGHFACSESKFVRK